jgi:hypothetical protein
MSDDRITTAELGEIFGEYIPMEAVYAIRNPEAKTPDEMRARLREIAAQMNKSKDRVAIVSDENGDWYVRRVRTVEHDLSKDEKVYHCDKPIGLRFPNVEGAVMMAKRYLGIDR